MKDKLNNFLMKLIIKYNTDLANKIITHELESKDIKMVNISNSTIYYKDITLYKSTITNSVFRKVEE